jgi:hypothetical protein
MLFFRSVVFIAALLGVSAFHAPVVSRAVRTSSPTMSHFSLVKTQLRNKKALVQSLYDLGMEVVVAEEGQTQEINGYKGLKEQAELKISQQNGHDIGFKFNGKSYELVSDLAYWQQGYSVETFVQKLSVHYAVNTIKEVSEVGGFAVQEQVNQQDGTIAMTLSRWN